MKPNSLRFLVDTNIWLDYFLPFRSKHSLAFQFLDAAISLKVQLFHAATTAKDVHYFVYAFLKKAARKDNQEITKDFLASAQELAWANLEQMEELSTLVGMDRSDYWIAKKLRPFNSDIEDNLIMAAAERAQVNYLVTNDKGLLRKSTVTTLTPEDAIELLKALTPCIQE